MVHSAAVLMALIFPIGIGKAFTIDAGPPPPREGCGAITGTTGIVVQVIEGPTAPYGCYRKQPVDEARPNRFCSTSTTGCTAHPSKGLSRPKPSPPGAVNQCDGLTSLGIMASKKGMRAGAPPTYSPSPLAWVETFPPGVCDEALASPWHILFEHLCSFLFMWLFLMAFTESAICRLARSIGEGKRLGAPRWWSKGNAVR